MRPPYGITAHFSVFGDAIMESKTRVEARR